MRHTRPPHTMDSRSDPKGRKQCPSPYSSTARPTAWPSTTSSSSSALSSPTSGPPVPHVHAQRHRVPRHRRLGIPGGVCPLRRGTRASARPGQPAANAGCPPDPPDHRAGTGQHHRVNSRQGRRRPGQHRRRRPRHARTTPARRAGGRPRPVHRMIAIAAPNWLICVRPLDLMGRRNTANIQRYFTFSCPSATGCS